MRRREGTGGRKRGLDDDLGGSRRMNIAKKRKKIATKKEEREK